MQDRVDSKACLVTFCMHIPYLLLFAVTGALLGSGLYLLIAFFQNRTPEYVAETEYYIDFAEGRLEAADYYNDFTWNDVLATDLILGRTMEGLGESYNRTEIKDMITADILSDVRYLTITVQGTDADLVGRVSEETKISLENFAVAKEEFDSIEQIEDNGVILKKTPLFTWRAAALGTLLAGLLYCIWFFIRFHMEDRFYTRADVTKLLHVSCLGILNGNKKKFCVDLICTDNLSYMTAEKKQKIACLNLGSTDVRSACDQDNTVWLTKEELNKQGYEKMRNTDGIVLFIPWGKANRKKVEDVIYNLQIQECKILGAVLTDADEKWLTLYGLH